MWSNYRENTQVSRLSDPDEKNNFQVYLHETLINKGIAAVRKAGYSYKIDSAFISQFKLPINPLAVKWIAHVFPKLLCSFDKDAEAVIELSVSPNLDSSLHFNEGKLTGNFSPMLKFIVGGEHAFSFTFRIAVDVNLQFTPNDKTSIIKGTLNGFDMADVTFVAAKVPSSDLADIINKFKPMALPKVIETANGILAAGVTIPVLQVFKQAFEVDVDTVILYLKPQYVEAAVTVDIQS